MMQSLARVLVLALLTARVASASDLVLMWNDLLMKAVRKANTPPPLAVRNMAIVHLAMHDAVNGVERKYTQYQTKGIPPENTSVEVSASAACYYTLRVLIPESSEMLDSHYRAMLSVRLKSCKLFFIT